MIGIARTGLNIKRLIDRNHKAQTEYKKATREFMRSDQNKDDRNCKDRPEYKEAY